LVLFGMLFVLPYLLERSLRMSTGATGLLITVLPLAMAVAAPLAGRASDVLGARMPTFAGMLAASLGLAVAAVDPDTLGVIAGLVLVGLGVGLFTPSNNAAIMASVPAHRVGVGSGVVNLTRGLGTALGLSVAALVFGQATAGSSSPGATRLGFEHTAAVLAVIALAAACAALFRRPRAQERPVA
jgi:MFS family permease